MPKREIHEEMRASAHDLEEVEERGVASSQQVVREDVCVTLRRRKRANKVNVNV
jgi:hypothetical protein